MSNTFSNAKSDIPGNSDGNKNILDEKKIIFKDLKEENMIF